MPWNIRISWRMRERYLSACRIVVRIIATGQIEDGDLDGISEAKGMFNRIARRDQRDWQDVCRILGGPGTDECRRAAFYLADLRSLIKEGKPFNDLTTTPSAKFITERLGVAEKWMMTESEGYEFLKPSYHERIR